MRRRYKSRARLWLDPPPAAVAAALGSSVLLSPSRPSSLSLFPNHHFLIEINRRIVILHHPKIECNPRRFGSLLCQMKEASTYLFKRGFSRPSSFSSSSLSQDVYLYIYIYIYLGLADASYRRPCREPHHPVIINITGLQLSWSRNLYKSTRGRARALSWGPWG